MGYVTTGIVETDPRKHSRKHQRFSNREVGWIQYRLFQVFSRDTNGLQTGKVAVRICPLAGRTKIGFIRLRSLRIGARRETFDGMGQHVKSVGGNNEGREGMKNRRIEKTQNRLETFRHNARLCPDLQKVAYGMARTLAGRAARRRTGG